jgi:excisionase family DNA binding protein
MGQEYLREEEAAEYTTVHPATLRTAAKRGELRKVKLGRRLVYRKSDLDDWMASHVVETSEESS